jgi:predicted DNA-binding ribbon-helix-helix protein
MKSTVIKRSVVIAGHKTSVSLEDAFWKGLKEIARCRNSPLAELVAVIDSERKHSNLSSAIRLFVLGHYRSMIDGAAGERPSPQQATSPDPARLSSTAVEPGRP